MGLYEQRELEDYAEVLWWALKTSRHLPFKRGAAILIRYDYPAVALAEAVYSRLMDENMHPFALANPTTWMEAEHFINSSFGQLTAQQPGLAEMYEACDGVVSILAPESIDHLASVDPRTLAEERRARRGLLSSLELRRLGGTLGWTTCVYPTEALARAAGMELAEYARELARACYLTEAEPVRAWKNAKKRADAITAELDALGPSVFHVEGEGIDLFFNPGPRRRWVGVNGANIPGYEIFVAPDAGSVGGVYFANQPSVHVGHLVHGARLEFHEGIVVQASAERGQMFLQQRLYADSGARRIGEFSLTDVALSRVGRFMAHTLLDENLGGEHGNCHIALGGSPLSTFAGMPQELDAATVQELGFNSSDVHWDLVNTQPKRVTVERPGAGRATVYENGRFAF